MSGAVVTSDTGAFALVPEWVLTAKISAQAVRLYAVLAKRADQDTRECYPSRVWISKQMGCSVDVVDRAMKQLVALGAVEKHARRDEAGDSTSNMYVVRRVMPGVAAEIRPPGREDPGTGGRGSAALNETQFNREERAGASRPAESPNETDEEPEEPKLEPFEHDFNRAWKFYPRKEARKAALEQYQRRRRAGADPAEIHKAVQVYAFVIEHSTRAKMLGSTFFGRAERWKDFLDRDAAMARERPPDSRFGAPPSGRPQPKTQSRCPTCDELEIDCRCPQAAAS